MLKAFDAAIYRPIASGRFYVVRFDGAWLTVESELRELRLKTEIKVFENAARIDIGAGNPERWVALVALEAVFGHFPAFDQIAVYGSEEFVVKRSEFYQNSEIWLRPDRQKVSSDEKWISTNGYEHPVRPEIQRGTYYRRYLPSIGKTISFRLADIEKDLERFHRWHNDPRVYDLWELNKPMDELKTYLENGLKDPHQKPMIVEFDEEPAGYFEFYWAAEDRLGPYYDRDPYDRGFHFLIGEDRFLGQANTDEVVRSVTHVLFLDDPRTQRVVAEPRSDNKRVLKYVELVPGWRFIKEFDFPHKRAALVSVRRDDFFIAGRAP